jgi:hypothetical protein
MKGHMSGFEDGMTGCRRWVIPIWIKISYSLYALILVPVYWVKYGPANFLWFSDIAFLGIGAALWLESRFIASMMAAGTLVTETIWNVDFFFRLISGRTLLNVADYMFDVSIPLDLRALSGFHLFLPPLELWLVSRLGYDPKAWRAQVALACIAVPASRLASDESLNVNWVYGPGLRQKQLPDAVYVGLVAAVVVIGFILPGHLILKRLFGEHR